MSLVPHIAKELLKELYCESLGSLPHTNYIRPWRLTQAEDSGVSSLVKDQDGIKVGSVNFAWQITLA